ncbi:SAC3 family protein C isoform X2 [Nymphaea colorata]|uniref:SAC3 family protein C isoform X2 n=1 Tax=Nymphaea colorata TaxID=210225 RepID=UPI00129ED3FB|nr:SAC3 family protein C isoform X2 [Nymphaea colorata]
MSSAPTADRNPTQKSVEEPVSQWTGRKRHSDSKMHRNKDSAFTRAKGNRNPSLSSAMDSGLTWGRRGSSSSQGSASEREGEPESLPFVVGNCPDMCPARERAERERLRDLAVFERFYGNPRKTSSSLAVKKFCRTISSVHVHASDIRPLPVLQDTLAHLFNLLESSDQPFEVVHEFVFDRTRSIRQDLSMQNISGYEAVDMYEQMVMFHIKSHHKLLQRENVSTSSMHYLNLEQLKKSLKTLYDLYDVNRSSGFVSKHEAEFYSFHVLLHLGSNCQATGESLATWFWRLEPHLLKSKDLSFVRSVLRYFRINNFKQFFCMVAERASHLQLCLLEPLFNEVRAQALSSINHCGYKLHPYPLSHLAKLLMMKESDMESFCNLCGLETITDETGKKFLPTKQNSFNFPKGGHPMYNFERGEFWLL